MRGLSCRTDPPWLLQDRDRDRWGDSGWGTSGVAAPHHGVLVNCSATPWPAQRAQQSQQHPPARSSPLPFGTRCSLHLRGSPTDLHAPCNVLLLTAFSSMIPGNIRRQRGGTTIPSWHHGFSRDFEVFQHCSCNAERRDKAQGCAHIRICLDKVRKHSD